MNISLPTPLTHSFNPPLTHSHSFPRPFSVFSSVQLWDTWMKIIWTERSFEQNSLWSFEQNSLWDNEQITSLVVGKFEIGLISLWYQNTIQIIDTETEGAPVGR